MVKLILAKDNCGFQSNLAFEFQRATREDRLSKENNNFEPNIKASFQFSPGTIGDIMDAGDDSDVEEVSTAFFSDGEKERWFEEAAVVEEVTEEVGDVSTSKDKKEEELEEIARKGGDEYQGMLQEVLQEMLDKRARDCQ